MCSEAPLTPQVGEHSSVHRGLKKTNSTFVCGDLKKNDIPLLQGDCNLLFRGKQAERIFSSISLVIDTRASHLITQEGWRSQRHLFFKC